MSNSLTTSLDNCLLMSDKIICARNTLIFHVYRRAYMSLPNICLV